MLATNKALLRVGIDIQATRRARFAGVLTNGGHPPECCAAPIRAPRPKRRRGLRRLTAMALDFEDAAAASSSSSSPVSHQRNVSLQATAARVASRLRRSSRRCLSPALGSPTSTASLVNRLLGEGEAEGLDDGPEPMVV